MIRSIPYGETHAIVTLLTPQGKLAAMARGAKKPQSRLAGGVQLCVHAMYTLSQGRGMGTVQQLEVVDAHRPLRERLDLAAYAAYFCELVGSAADERPNGSDVTFRWFNSALSRLAQGEPPPSVVARIWEAKVLRLIGASPDWLHCVQCGRSLSTGVQYAPANGGLICFECSQGDGRRSTNSISTLPSLPGILDQFARVPWERIGAVRLNDQTRAQLSQILRHQLHDFGGLSLKSRSFVDKVDDFANL